jgi:hypothetical protein
MNSHQVQRAKLETDGAVMSEQHAQLSVSLTSTSTFLNKFKVMSEEAAEEAESLRHTLSASERQAARARTRASRVLAFLFGMKFRLRASAGM